MKITHKEIAIYVKFEDVLSNLEQHAGNFQILKSRKKAERIKWKNPNEKIYWWKPIYFYNGDHEFVLYETILN